MTTPTTLRVIYWDSTRPAKLLTAALNWRHILAWAYLEDKLGA